MPQEEKLKKLKALLEVANDGIGKKDFETSFKTLIDFVKKVKNGFDERFNTLDTFVNKVSKDLEVRYSNKDNEITKRLSKIKDGAKGDKGDTGANGNDGVIGEQGIQGINGADGSPDTPKLIRDKLETIKKEKDKLAIDAIGFLEERLKKLEQRKTGGVSGGGVNFGGVIQHDVSSEELSGTKNSVNKIFTINYTPSPATTLKVYRGGARQQLNPAGTTDGDYSYSAKNITFNLAPVSGEILVCDYVR